MDEMKRRITLGNRSYYSLLKILKSTSVSRNSKCALYKSVIRPIVTYGSESWCMTQKDEQSLLTFEKRYYVQYLDQKIRTDGADDSIMSLCNFIESQT